MKVAVGHYHASYLYKTQSGDFIRITAEVSDNNNVHIHVEDIPVDPCLNLKVSVVSNESNGLNEYDLPLYTVCKVCNGKGRFDSTELELED